jgi:two-component system, NarL family, response regulator NreC
MVRIVVVDDHFIFLEGVKKLFEDESGYQVVGTASDGREGVALIKTLQPDIAILDITMPGLNGLDAARAISKVSPLTKTIVLTMHNEEPYVNEALNAGVHGYVIKSQTAGDLLRAAKEVAAGRVYLSPGIARIVIDGYRHDHKNEIDALSMREREVLQLIAEGHKTKEVASRLGISVKTAESHRTRIMTKLDIHETAGLVRYAIRRGLVSP